MRKPKISDRVLSYATAKNSKTALISRKSNKGATMGHEPPIKIIPHPELIEKAEALLAAGLLDHECWERLEEMSMGKVETIIKSMSVPLKSHKAKSTLK